MHATDNGRDSDTSSKHNEMLGLAVPFGFPEYVSEVHHVQDVSGLQLGMKEPACFSTSHILYDVLQSFSVLVGNGIGAAQFVLCGQ